MELLGLTDPILIAIASASLAALSFYVVFAAGQFNVAQPGFMSIGAYGVAYVTTNGLPLVLGIVAGIALSAVLAVALASVTKRLSGVYLAIATLAFVQVVEQTIYITPWLSGSIGIYGIPVLVTATGSLAILAAALFVVHRLMNTRLGYEMRVLREDPIVARGVGINEWRLRVFASVASAVLAAIAGMLKALSTSYISPDEFGFSLLILVLSFAVLGGTDRYWGPVLGAVVLTLLPEYTRAFDDYRMVFTGAIIIAAVILFPEGIAGALIRAGELLHRLSHRHGPRAEQAIPLSDLGRRRVLPDEQPVVGRAEGMNKRFGGVVAVDSVALELRQATVHGLIGPNGAGKSTLVDLLSGEQRSEGGAVHLGERNVTALPAYRRSRLGIVRTFQHSRVTQSISALDVVYSGCLIARRASSLGAILALPKSRQLYRDCATEAEGLLLRLGLHAVRGRYVRDLGWEEQRRLEIARALALKPSVLLLDEPTAGMHESSLPGFGALVREVASHGVAVVLIEHNVAFIRSTVDVLYAMAGGRMLLGGQPDQVLADPAVIDSYLGAAHDRAA